MNLQNISLKNYRNYDEVAVETDNQMVLILGDNAAGKTNFIESIYFLSNLKSFRTPDNLLPKQGEDYFKIAGQTSDVQMEAIVQVNPSLKRQFKLNGQKVSRVNWKTFSTVLFVPNDLNMFILGPALRRKFLNDILSQKEKTYSADLAGLEHILKQKAALLSAIQRGEAKSSELEFWYNELAQVSVRLSQLRREFLDYVSEQFENIYTGISGFKSGFKIVYSGLAEDATVGGFLDNVRKYQDAEIRSGQNLIGPHRDDFTVYKDNELNIHNSSRGELRSQILTLKLAQAKYLSSGNDRPIILLDDVFSELDETRRNKLLESLSEHQIFITSTEEHHLPKLVPGAKILSVANNRIG